MRTKASCATSSAGSLTVRPMFEGHDRAQPLSSANGASGQQIDIDGLSFAYRESGRGDPLVLVHANLSDMRSWESLEPLLAEHFRVISYSRRFAHPNRPAGDSDDDPLSQHVEDLISLIQTLRLGKVHLVGNSSGAFVCLLAAQQRPDLVHTLTLEEPPVVSMFLQALPPKPGELFKLLFSSPGALIALLKFGATAIGPATEAFKDGDDVAALDLFARGVLGTAAFAKITPARKRQMTDNVKAHRAALLGAGLPVFTAADAAAVTTPTQLLRGAETPGFQRRINERLARLISGAKDICVPNASHLVHEDNPHAVADAIRTFCGAERRLG
jgi:pimeloyl-ACP methyl ester carboxylesterase